MEREKTYKEPPEISQAREIMERVIATEGVAQITPEEGGIIYKAEILQAEATKKHKKIHIILNQYQKLEEKLKKDTLKK